MKNYNSLHYISTQELCDVADAIERRIKQSQEQGQQPSAVEVAKLKLLDKELEARGGQS